MKSHPDLTSQQLDEYLKTQTSQPTASASKVSQTGFKTQQTAKTILGVREGEKSLWVIFITFVQLGIQHILSGPDHILFVLSLLLVFTNVRTTIKLFTAFTLAHSITLILSGTGLLILSSRIVEPLIALSIAYVAVTSVFFKGHQLLSGEWGKIFSVFFFGLFHGLGFAGVLQDFTIPSDRFINSLLFFNVGIEIGQLIILSLVLPFIYLFWKKHWYPNIIRVFSVAITLLALVWVVERVFGISIIT